MINSDQFDFNKDEATHTDASPVTGTKVTKKQTKTTSQRRTVRVRKKNMDKKAAWTLEQMAEGVNSEDTDVQLTATVKLRQCISRQDIGDGSLTLDVQRIIDLKLVPRLIHLLSFGTHPKLVYETCWVLTNICKETFPQTKTVVDAGVIPVLVTKFQTADHELKGQLAWLVGNIAAECVNFRKQFVEVGIVPLLSEFISTSFDKKMLGEPMQTAVWAVGNLCLKTLGKFLPAEDEMKDYEDCDWTRSLLPTLTLWNRLLSKCNDFTVLNDTIFVVKNLFESPTITPTMFYESGIVKGIVHGIQKSDDVGNHSRYLMNEMSKTLEGRNALLGCDAWLTTCWKILTMENKKDDAEDIVQTMHIQICCVVSKFLEEHKDRMKDLIDTKIIPAMFDLLYSTTVNWAVKKEVLTALSHAVHGEEAIPYVPYFVSQGVLQRFCGAFAIFDKFVLRDCLRGLEDVLKFGATTPGNMNTYVSMVTDMGGVMKLVRLQQHQDNEVYLLALRILEIFFADVLEEDDKSSMLLDSAKGTKGQVQNEDEEFLCGQPPRVFRFEVGQRVECLIMESERGGVWEQGVVEELDYHHMCGHCRMLHQSAYLVKLDNGEQCKSSIDDDSMIKIPMITVLT
jgi:importin subunit alpha-6/7